MTTQLPFFTQLIAITLQKWLIWQII